jgi:hypothetical protein
MVSRGGLLVAAVMPRAAVSIDPEGSLGNLGGYSPQDPPMKRVDFINGPGAPRRVRNYVRFA